MISIHAPTWGATQPVVQLLCDIIISIHAPTWGATYWGTPSSLRRTNFNPRTHVGCDPRRQTAALPPPHFNPRTHVGCDDYGVERSAGTRISIHAPTWGATPSNGHISTMPQISIHAPTWGATVYEAVLGWLREFQSTHPRGVRLSRV